MRYFKAHENREEKEDRPYLVMVLQKGKYSKLWSTEKSYNKSKIFKIMITIRQIIIE